MIGYSSYLNHCIRKAITKIVRVGIEVLNMGKIEKIMYPCRYWKHVGKYSKNDGDMYSNYSDYEEDIKPEIKNKYWDKEVNGIFFFFYNLNFHTPPNKRGIKDNSRYFFLFLSENICWYPSFEPSRRDGSNERPQNIFEI